MMKSKLSVIISLALMAGIINGCRPEGVLSSGKLQEVLYDMHLTDGVIEQIGYTYGHEKEVDSYYAVVLEKHGITQAQLDSTLKWYTAHPKRFEHVYPKVLARLEADKAAIETAISIQDGKNAEPRLSEVEVKSQIDSLMRIYRDGFYLRNRTCIDKRHFNK